MKWSNKRLSGGNYAIAERNGIRMATARKRFKELGWSIEESIEIKPRPVQNLWNHYKEISVVSDSAFYDRIKRGMTPYEAATTPKYVRLINNIHRRKGGLLSESY